MGAWIEIAFSSVISRMSTVAPLVGAWIEIKLSALLLSLSPVAPLVGAWIEITEMKEDLVEPRPSLPLWERGLKSYSFPGLVMLFTSLPLWERGLK